MARAYRGASGRVVVCPCGCDRAFTAYDARRVYYSAACKQAAYRARKRRQRELRRRRARSVTR